ncbi:MAG: glycerophosphodiester phosphodiesterase family protein [Methanolinea sp.]
MEIIAHRGASARAAENTLAAVRLATGCADYVEVDVRLSRDRVPVVMHDPTVDRTTNGKGRVGDFTAAELRALDAGQGEHVPTLEEVCGLVEGRTGLCVELKEPGSGYHVCDVLERHSPRPLLVVSFHGASLAAVHEIMPEVPLGLVSSRPGIPRPRRDEDVPLHVFLLRFDVLSKEIVREARARGMRVIPWTLDAEAEWEEACRLGVDGFATDDPCRAREWAASRK